MKIKMEENIASLTDQIQLLEAVHQMNEERLDYEIHVLRKHEEVQEVKMSKVGDKKKSALPKLNEHRQLLSQKAVGKIYKDQHSYQNPKHDKASTNNNRKVSP